MEGSDSMKLFNHKSKKTVIKELSLQITDLLLEKDCLSSRIEELNHKLDLVVGIKNPNTPRFQHSFYTLNDRKVEKVSCMANLGYRTLRGEPVAYTKERLTRALVEELQKEDMVDYDLIELQGNDEGKAALVATLYVARKL